MLFLCFFYTVPPPTEIYTYGHPPSLHDPLPIDCLAEGHLFSRLPASEQKRDPLLPAAGDIASIERRFGLLGPLLSDWLEPLFPKDGPAERRLRLAICLLSDLAWREHPDYRASHAFTRILHLHICGIAHVERIMAAHDPTLRSGGDPTPPATADARARLAP